MSGQFDPYEDNGGTTIAIAGSNFCVIAADTRQSNGGYAINTRFAPKAHRLNEACVLATSGFHADGCNFAREIRKRMEAYQYDHGRAMSAESVAQLMQVVLYQKRFFPYYTFSILGGVDVEGRGAVFSFDPVGSYEREAYRAGGSAAALVQPYLDGVVGRKNVQDGGVSVMTVELAVQLVKDAFSAACERDIYTGDSVEIYVITKEAGTSYEKFDLKKD